MKWLPKYCECCRRIRFGVARRRENTKFVDDEQNFVTCCEECFAIRQDYWADMWSDYYSGCM